VTTAETTTHPYWLAAIRRYLVVSAIGHLLWEVAQLPLYTLWHSASPGQIARTVLHCWIGDLAIASAVFVLALAIAGTREWPVRHVVVVGFIALVLSVGYTAYSEYVNSVIRQNWAYADMPAD
jgi:hypothetical protein